MVVSRLTARGHDGRFATTGPEDPGTAGSSGQKSGSAVERTCARDVINFDESLTLHHSIHQLVTRHLASHVAPCCIVLLLLRRQVAIQADYRNLMPFWTYL